MIREAIVHGVKQQMSGDRETKGGDIDATIMSITVGGLALASSATFLVMNSMFLIMIEVAEPGLGAWKGYGVLHAFLAVETVIAFAFVMVSAYFLKRGLSAIGYVRKGEIGLSTSEPPAETAPAGMDTGTNRNVTDFLDGSEKDVYDMILSAGGSILQRNIVNQDRYSRSKVTRIIDRLERMGLVDRIRHGSTNLIVVRKQSK